jgi:hypothetical protein
MKTPAWFALPCAVLLIACGSGGSEQARPASSASPDQPAGAHIPRDAAVKLLDICASAAPKATGDAPPPAPGETGELEKDASGSASVRLFGVRPDSGLGKVGLLNGDKVTEINGVAAGQPKERWDALRGAKRLDIKLVRRGAPSQIVLTVD